MPRFDYDVGDVVICDMCDEDFTASDAIGGMLFVTKGVCPSCVSRVEAAAQRFGEKEHIRARARPGERFRDFILRMRGGNSTMTIITSD